LFEQRLRTALIALAGVVLIIVLRLVQLQVVHGATYQAEAEALLRNDPTPLPFARGCILDRQGHTLVSDEPCWEIQLDYEVIGTLATAATSRTRGPSDTPEGAEDEDFVASGLRRYRRALRFPSGATSQEKAATLRAEFADTAESLVDFAARHGILHEQGGPITVNSLCEDSAQIVARVRRIREAVKARRGYAVTVREEVMPHALVGGLDAAQQVAARETFARYPWVHVVDSTYRCLHGRIEPLAQVLGRLGRVDAADIADDSQADNLFARYLPNERLGITGVEQAAEQRLRGRRGQLITDREGNELEIIPPEDGADVTLTLRQDLQSRLYDLIGAAVRAQPLSSGGTAVVLDVRSREVLALVSYPGYDARRFNEIYDDLRDDTATQPLRFRAVMNQYPPGSIMKPLTCLTALRKGVVSLDTRIECTGYLFPEYRDRWRCWEIAGTGIRKAHGPVNVVESLRGSCNVYMYKVGEMVGIDALCNAFYEVGIGRPSGLGLIEEAEGVNPTPAWLASRGRGVSRGKARLFAIGQGELLVTPVQVANLVAVYASGSYQQVKLVRNDGRERPRWQLPGRPEYWAAIREGLYEVVNDPEGTAYRTARFTHPDYALCGKTGSATAYPWPTAYYIPCRDQDGNLFETVLPAGSRKDAMDRFAREYPDLLIEEDGVRVASTWPPSSLNDDGETSRHAHAWFAGFLQRIDAQGQPVWSEQPHLAFVVLIEFGSSGGHTAAPVAKDMCSLLLDILGPDLDPDYVAPEPADSFGVPRGDTMGEDDSDAGIHWDDQP
jgi:cell division protein FtsI/penicillin-binding protein 2